MQENTQPPFYERPRERLLRHGVDSLSSAELLAIILRTGSKGLNAVDMGKELLLHFGGLKRLLTADTKELLSFPGIGIAKTCELLAIKELSQRALEEPLRIGPVLNQPDKIKQYCAMQLAHLQIEHCIALYLNTQLKLIECKEVARGTLSQASVYPREILKEALRLHSGAIILAHNHPSGLAEPSAADINFTRQLKQSLALVDIRLLDHLVVGSNKITSFDELGLM